MGRQAQARLSSTDCPEPHTEEGLEWEPAVPEETGEDPGQTVSHCLTPLLPAAVAVFLLQSLSIISVNVSHLEEL